jgi:HEAT repeat protein
MIPLLTRMARNQGDDHYNSVVEESAALALGILQDRSPEVKRFLAGVASDPTAKRRTRCFAAFGLGLLGESGQRAGYAAESYAALRSLVASPAESDRDVARSALVGIGLLRDPMAVADLREWLESGSAGSRKLDDLELSYVAAALGKIGIPGDGALAALRGQILRKNRMTRYSSVIALGQIAPRADEDTQADCVRTLANVVKCEGKATSDPQTVNFALASLGRIAASTAHDGVRDRALEVLGSCFAEGKSSRSFAALGLGFALFEKSPALRTSWAEKILYALDRSTGDVEQRGALCIALGLLRDVRSASSLRNILRDRGIDRPLRGTAALALGLLGDRDSREDVREALLEKGNVEMRVDAAMAAVLLQDGAAVDSMIDVLRDPKSSQLLRGSVAGALGRIGDRRALRPLAELLGDGNAPDLTRALACVALGQIGDREDVPVLADISRDVNYRAGYDAISEVLTIL